MPAFAITGRPGGNTVRIRRLLTWDGLPWGAEFVGMAGPCPVEGDPQKLGPARKVRLTGAHIMRGGDFKPHTSLYNFQNLAE